ncbi:hypothetical protein PsYK624_136960 [Phanerochaete sordida]|uniref:F-box domain-containing protein n=1 Tax=Phanerochaete sordida TaxID=48140 RepID=A0A9P3GLG0_9APHY|nr:hypothetical protein PsYK624_136960 [Phanerochaete sordida]
MHRCLRIAEVVQVIADGIHLYSDLVSMGLTCRAFFDPAMDRLWRYLPAPEPLIRLLPEHVRGSEPADELKIMKQPSREDWKRFEQYARRVWELDYRLVIDDDGNTCLDIDWTSILRHYPGEQLLPNLRTLATDQIFLPSFSPLVIRSPLRHLVFECMEGDDQLPIAPHLHKCATTLQILSILAPTPEDENVSDEMSDAISRLEALTSLYTDKLFASTIEHLSHLSCLTELSFTLHNTSVFKVQRLPFSKLEDLHVRTHEKDPKSLVAFLRRVESPNLHQLTVSYDVKDDHVLPGRLLRANQYPTAVHVGAVLAAAATFPGLHNIAYEGSSGISRPPPLGSLCAASVLRPLAVLPSLEEIKLACIPFILMPNDVEFLAQTWPRLRSLSLGSEVRGAHASVQVHDLLPFARCPDLKSLGLPLLVLKDSPGATERPAFGELESSLETLYIGNVATVEYSPDVAAFLACAFPDAWLYAYDNHSDAFSALLMTKKTMVDMMKKELALRGGA